jgi:hypothetical protein
MPVISGKVSNQTHRDYCCQFKLTGSGNNDTGGWNMGGDGNTNWDGNGNGGGGGWGSQGEQSGPPPLNLDNAFPNTSPAIKTTSFAADPSQDKQRRPSATRSAPIGDSRWNDSRKIQSWGAPAPQHGTVGGNGSDTMPGTWPKGGTPLPSNVGWSSGAGGGRDEDAGAGGNAVPAWHDLTAAQSSKDPPAWDMPSGGGGGGPGGDPTVQW